MEILIYEKITNSRNPWFPVCFASPSFHVGPNNNPILYFLHVYPKNSPRINHMFISCMFSLEKNKDKRERRDSGACKGTMVLRSALPRHISSDLSQYISTPSYRFA